MSQYYLGLGSEQTGPYSEQDLLQKIQRGEIPDDALLWQDGMPDWQPIRSLKAFDQAFRKAGDSDAFAPPASHQDEGRDMEAKPGEPVFNSRDAVFIRSPLVRYRSYFVLGGLLLGGLFIYMAVQQWNTEELRKPAQDAINTGVNANTREARFRKAMSELAIFPEASITAFKQIIKENNTDQLATEALKASVQYFRQTRRPEEAGRMLLSMNQAAEAATYFVMEPPHYEEADGAYRRAFAQTKNPQFLVDDIRVLLAAKNLKDAMEQIKLLQKDFPNTPHPYGYYLKTSDEKIAEIFRRLSFFFVQTLLAYLDSELPQIHLSSRPLVEVKRDASDKYRIEANYSGEVLLNHDRMPHIHFTLWYVQDHWVIVDTNLTKERQSWSRQDKEKAKSKLTNADEMLALLEGVFQQQFPKRAVHEEAVRDMAEAKN